MGYGGAPPWVYKREMAYREMSANEQISQRDQRIVALEKENEELKKRIKELEEELNTIKNRLSPL